MRSWSYAINSLKKTSSISLEEAPFYIFSLDSLVGRICDYMPSISFPRILKKLKDKEDIKWNDGKEWTTWKDWYGDLSQFFCTHVHNPISNFCHERMRTKSVPMDYDKLRAIFYSEDKDFWDEEEALDEEL